MAKNNQLETDRERLSVLISRYTGISRKRIYDFIAANGAGELLSSANRVATTDTQREKLNNLFEFKNLYEIVKGAKREKDHFLDSTDAAREYLKNFFSDRNDKERLAAVYLDARHKVIATKVMSVGEINSAPVFPREITREALFYNASGVILSHNHPTGSLDHSSEDRRVSDEVRQSLSTVGVNLLDHIITAGDDAVSLADKGLIKAGNLKTKMNAAASPVHEGVVEYIINNRTQEVKITMGDNTAETAVPLAENEHIKELFGILRDNGKDTSGLSALLDHVQSMEDFIKLAEGKIVDMKSQLDTMKEIQDHPVKTALQKTIKALETAVAEIKIQLAELKANIIESCKNAVEAFKEKGAAALDKLASFFHIKKGLQVIKNNALISVSYCDRSIAQVEAFSREYHASGRHIKNMARVLIGKDPIDTVKETGKLAKAINAPTQAHKACLLGIRKQVDKMISALDSLEQRVELRRDEKAMDNKPRKPTLMERLESKKNEIKQRELEKPALERELAPKSKGLEV